MTHADDRSDRAAFSKEQEEQLREMVVEGIGHAVVAGEIHREDQRDLEDAAEQERLGLLTQDTRFRVIKALLNEVPRLSTHGNEAIPERIRSRGPGRTYPPGLKPEVGDLLEYETGDFDPLRRAGLAECLAPDRSDEPTLWELTAELPRLATTIHEAERAVGEVEADLDGYRRTIAELQEKAAGAETEITRRRETATQARQARERYLAERSPAWRAAADRGRRPTTATAGASKSAAALTEEERLAQDYRAGRVSQSRLVYLTELIRKGRTYAQAVAELDDKRGANYRWDAARGVSVRET